MAVTVRFDRELEERVKERASLEHRSLSSLVVHAVEHYIDHTATDAQVEELLPGIVEQVAAAADAYDARQAA